MRLRFFNTHEPVTTYYRDLLPALAGAGHEVEVYISRADYRSGRGPLARAFRHPNLRVRSFSALGRRDRPWIMSSYALQAALASLFAGPVDANIFLSQPPLFAAWGWLLKVLRGQRYFCVLMDLYPEAAVRDGMLRENSLTVRLLAALARLTWRGADALVVIGRCQMEALIAAGAPRAKIHLIPNWASDQLTRAVAPARDEFRRKLHLQDSFVILYSGNMGIAHEFRTLLDASERLLAHPGIRLVLMGDGVRRAELEREKCARNLTNLFLLPFQPADRLAESLSLGDIHLVTLRDGFEGVVVPSKAYAAQALGKPLIYVGHPSGEIARMVNEARIGTVVASGDAAGLASAILKYSQSRSLRQTQGRNALALYRKQYHPRNSLLAYRRLLEGIGHDQ
jgi:glycosyltransferase involved in cell wall biosynthesis